jgi:hypothetical protein
VIAIAPIGVPHDPRMLFRVGINLGDVLVEGDDILGDGVNVPARLEGIPEPGGICLSSSAHDQVRGKVRSRLTAGASRIRTPGPTCDGIDMKRRSRAVLGGDHDGPSRRADDFRSRGPRSHSSAVLAASIIRESLDQLSTLGLLRMHRAA